MFAKIKTLCKPEPKRKENSALDSLATIIFNQESKDRYQFIRSSTPPETRYGIEVKNTRIFLSPYLSSSDGLGPNEEWLISKIFDQSTTLTYIVGGVGVGKSSFTNFLINEILPKINHSTNADVSHCPSAIKFDFLDQKIADVFPAHDPKAARRKFEELICVRIKSVLATKRFFTLEEEITSVWTALIKSNETSSSSNPAIDDLIIELFERQADDSRLNHHRAEILASRRQIRNQILSSENAIFYYAAILKHLKESLFHGHLPCLLLIIDNIDSTPPPLQVAIEASLKPFAKHSQVRTIFTVRQTTYYQGSNYWYSGYENFSRLVDHVPYCGADPVQVFRERLSSFLNKGYIYNLCSEVYETPVLEKIRLRLSKMEESFLRSVTFKEIFSKFCGHSNRKGLKLAQNLILNSVYDLLADGPNPVEVYVDGVYPLRISDIVKALIIGSSDTFEYKHDGVIENIFHTHSKPNESNLIKIRILRAIANHSNGMPVDKLRDIMQWFGYSKELILKSLDEMLNKEKRLIWINAGPAHFKTLEDLLAKKAHSELHINSIGLGYTDLLFKSLFYVEEVMLDTSVSKEQFGSDWSHGGLINSFKLVNNFCNYLLHQDITEMKKFKSLFPGSDYSDFYQEIFSDRWITSEIVENIAHDVDGVLKHSIGSGSSKRDVLVTFRKSQAASYAERLNWISLQEREFFNSSK